MKKSQINCDRYYKKIFKEPKIIWEANTGKGIDDKACELYLSFF